MRNVVFVAPLFREATNRFVRAFASLPGVRLATVGQDPLEAAPPDLRERIAAHELVRDSMDAESLTAAVQRLSGRIGPIDRVTGHLEQLQIPLGQIRDALDIEGMRGEASRAFRDKDRMKEILRRAGIPVARHRLVGSPQALWAFVKEVGLPVVVKPPAGLGAKATFRVGTPAELEAVLKRMPPTPSDPVQVEEFVVGQERTCETVSIAGEPVWRSGTRYLPSPLDVLENPWMQYCVVLPREADELDSFRPINDAALRALGMQTGMSHMEWFRREDGSALVNEVGARPPGAQIMPLMSLAHDVDMVARWAELIALDRFDPPQRRHAAGVAFFRGQGQGRVVRAVRGLDQAQEEVGRYVVDRRLPTPGQPRADGYEGEGYAIVRADTTDEVMYALGRLVQTVRVELG